MTTLCRTVLVSVLELNSPSQKNADSGSVERQYPHLERNRNLLVPPKYHSIQRQVASEIRKTLLILRVR